MEWKQKVKRGEEPSNFQYYSSLRLLSSLSSSSSQQLWNCLCSSTSSGRRRCKHQALLLGVLLVLSGHRQLFLTKATAPIRATTFYYSPNRRRLTTLYLILAQRQIIPLTVLRAAIKPLQI
jgi:hypothetical protein